MLYKTDKGWLFEKNSKKNYFQIDENSFRQTMVTDKQKYSVNNSFSKTLFGLHYSTIDNYKRSYPKIQSVIANCSGLIQVSFQITKFIVHMFTLGEYYSFLFDFDFNSSITINSVNNSVNNESKVELKKQGNANISFGRSKVKNTVHNKKKVSTLLSFRWFFFPNANARTRTKSKYEKRIMSFLSIENVFKALYGNEYSTLIETFDKNNMKNTTLKGALIKEGLNKANKIMCCRHNESEVNKVGNSINEKKDIKK